MPDRLAEADPERRVGDGNDDQAVPRAQRLIGRDVEVIVADAARRRAGGLQHRHRQAHHRQHRFEQRDVDVLSQPAGVPVVERQQDALRRVQPGEVVGDRHADAGRLAVLKAGHVHDAGFALEHRVVPRQLRGRPGLAVAGNRTVDQPRVHRRDRCVVETKLRQAARSKILNQHVGGLDQPAERRGALSRLEIERDALLAAVEREEEAAGAFHQRRPGARVVAVLRFFDLEDLGAHVAQHHRAERSRYHAREIDDPEAAQGSHGRDLITSARGSPAAAQQAPAVRDSRREALTLPVEERADVAAELLASLDEAQAQSAATVQAAWAHRSERRARRVMNGESAGEPWQDVRTRVIRRLTDRAPAQAGHYRAHRGNPGPHRTYPPNNRK